MDSDMIFLITGMFLVTYLPRVLPFFIFPITSFPVIIKNTLRILPVTALGALIIPGVFQEAQDYLIPGAGGIVVCIVVSYFRKDILLPVLASVAATFLLMQIFPPG